MATLDFKVASIVHVLSLCLATCAFGSDVTLEWKANVEPELLGYKIYYHPGPSAPPYAGTDANEGDSPILIYADDVTVDHTCSFSLSGLQENQVYYFVATAFDTQGNESGYSNEVCFNCEDNGSADAGENQQGDGTEWTSCSSNSDCDPESYCAKPEGHCGGEGVCIPVPYECWHDPYDPVCGCDEFTYANECEAAIYGVSVAYRGECGGVKRTHCSILGHDPRPCALDVNILKFSGTEGEAVTVTLESNPAQYVAGQRATLIIRNFGDELRLFKWLNDELPLEMTVTLPVSGDYHVKVMESPGRDVIWGQKYEGDYCVTLEASPGTVATFAPDLDVE